MNTGRSETAVIEQPDQAGRQRQNTDIAALTDGRFIAALFVLIANDHWLKAEYGNWLTGKASDIAGLIMLPVVVVSALRLARLRPNIRLILAAVGLWFAAIKLWPTAAIATEQLAEAMTGIHHQIIVDPTDLVGLIGLVVAPRIIANPRPLIDARVARLALLTLGLVATVATSSDHGSPNNDLIIEESSGEVVTVQRNSTIRDCDPPTADDDFDAEADVGTSEDQPPAELCTSPETTYLGLGEFQLESCPELTDLACVRAQGGAIQVSLDGTGWDTEWALDATSPTTLDLRYAADFHYEPAVQDLIVDGSGVTHVVYNDGLYVTRSGDGTWSRPFSEFRPIWNVVLAAVTVTLLSGAAVGHRRSRSRSWWVAPELALIGFALFVYGLYDVTSFLPVAEAIGVGLFAVAYLVCAVLVGNHRNDVRSLPLIGVVTAVTAALTCLPFVVWKYTASMSFHWTWVWLVIALVGCFAIDQLVGRRIAAMPQPPPPRPSE